MKYEYISIENFRGVKKLEIKGASEINLFLGKNNCSKTSILEAIFLLVGSLNPEILLRINRFRALNFNEQDDFRLIYNDLNYENIIKITASNQNGETKSLEIKPGSHSDKTTGKNKSIDPEDLDELGFDSSPNDILINQLVLHSKYKKIHAKEINATGKFIYKDGQFLIENGSFKNGPNERAVFLTQGLNLVVNLEKELESLIIRKQQHAIIEILQQVDDSIKDITLGRNRMIFVDTGLSNMIPLNLLGDGVRRMLMVILSIYNAKGGIVVIDEIDNGLHHSVFESLWRSVILTSIKTNTQVFITTHNYETLTYLNQAIKNVDIESHKDKIKTFTIRKLKNGEHKSYGYNYKQFENAIKESIEIR